MPKGFEFTLGGLKLFDNTGNDSIKLNFSTNVAGDTVDLGKVTRRETGRGRGVRIGGR